jgi:hypothetical protein
MEILVYKYGIIYLILSFFFLLLFKKWFYTIFDPFIFVVLSFSSAITLSLDSNLSIYILLTTFSFYFGMRIVNKSNPKNVIDLNCVVGLLYFQIYIYILTVVYMLLIIYVFAFSGVPLFSDNPTESKIAIFVPGLGFIRRFIFISSSIIPIGLILIYYKVKSKISVIVLMLIFTFLLILQGSKSSFLGVVGIFYILYTRTLSNGIRFIEFKKLKKYLMFFIPLVLLIFVFIVIKESEFEGGNLFASIGFRLMEFGDVALYYQKDSVQEYFRCFNIVNFIIDEFNGVLGMLRIVPYKDPLGFIMVKEYWSGVYTFDTVLGPNALFFIKGHIYFGFIGGILYAFIVGFIFNSIRKYMLNKEYRSMFLYAYSWVVFLLMTAYLRESSAFISQLFDMIAFNFPILCLSYVFYVFCKPTQK